ncbi:MAG: outer membrane beta-barrel protein [Flaviramulus sp.]|nr:outer membrane beta-barrel protein [Flaviramulus sp.]NNC50583.1 outer membrane beta-barrel protein [Flaviramulus sp.]
MKKLFLLSLTIFGFSFLASAQEISPNAIGLRLGDSDGLGAEISYQHALGDNNRLELDFGWRDGNNYNAFKLTGLYQWVFPLDDAFNWYVGAGGGIASFDGKNALNGDSETALFAAGDIGIEYSFDIPLQLSLDFRPELGFGKFTDDLDFDIAFGIRYQF